MKIHLYLYNLFIIEQHFRQISSEHIHTEYKGDVKSNFNRNIFFFFYPSHARIFIFLFSFL